MTETIEPDERGVSRVKFEEGTDYIVVDLPDGTTIDISVDPLNGNNHIKLYDNEDYSVLPMDPDSMIKPLEVWNGPVRSSTRSGTEPGNTEIVEPERDGDE